MISDHNQLSLRILQPVLPVHKLFHEINGVPVRPEEQSSEKSKETNKVFGRATACADLAGFGAKLEIILYSHHASHFCCCCLCLIVIKQG